MGAVVSNGRTGRSDADQPTVMKVARSPVFVDNCVHHAIYSTGNASSKMSVTPAKKKSFQITSDKTYQVIEEESAMRLIHTQTPGHAYEGDVYFGDGKLSTGSTAPVVIYGAEDYSERLVSETIESANSGSRFNLDNMKGRTLQSIGFEETSVRLGHEIDVGLRTTDLAMKLAVMGVDDVMTSVNLWRDSPPYATYQERVSHSQKFLAYDFHRTNLISALRFIGRHDGRIIRHDNFGNLSYMKVNDRLIPKPIGASLTDFTQTTANNVSLNRITIIGKQRGLNHNVQTVVNNSAIQINPDGSDFKRDIGPIVDPTVKNTASARKIGREILRQSQKSSGKIQANNTIGNTSLNAGDAVIMGGQKKMVASVTHKLTSGKSDVVLTDGFSAVESYNRFLDDDGFKNQDITDDATVGVNKEVLSFNGGLNIKITQIYGIRKVGQKGRLIGKSSRSVIGRKNNYQTSSGHGDVGAITITAAGSSYSVGDVITMTNAHSGTKMQLKVRDVNSGAVEKVVIVVAGTLYELSDALTQHSVSPSGGSGFQCTIPAAPYGLASGRGQGIGECKGYVTKISGGV